MKYCVLLDDSLPLPASETFIITENENSPINENTFLFNQVLKFNTLFRQFYLKKLIFFLIRLKSFELA